MGFTDCVNYVLFDNPISKGVVWSTKQVLQPLGSAIGLNGSREVQPQTIKIITERVPLWQLANNAGPFIKLGGISGALAVGLGAYGAHKKYPKDKMDELKAIFEKGNQYHLIHSVALLSAPLTTKPKITSSLFIVGMVFFCGACYHHAITDNDRFGKFAPIGGTLLILGWLSMIM